MRRTQSLKLSIGILPNVRTFVGNIRKIFSTAPRPRLLFRGKGLALPLQHTAAARRNLTREFKEFVFGCLPSCAFPQAIEGREARKLSSARGSGLRFPRHLRLRHA